MNRFVFVFPYHGVGGVPVLFLRIAERLSRMSGYEAYVVDYPDGAMGKAPRSPGVTLIPYDDNACVSLPHDAIIVFQSMTPWSVFPALRIDRRARLFFWTCHPFNLVPTMPGIRAAVQSNPVLGRLFLATLLRPYRNEMVRFTRFLLDRQALVFMDMPNLANTERYLGIRIPNPVFLPICGGDPKPRPRAAAARDWPVQGLRLCWVGRIADFKVHVLRRALTDLNRLRPALGVPIRFTVIGSGKYAAQLRSQAAGWSNLAIDFIDELPAAEIASYLQENVDVLFSMGTSALEGTSAGVSTILLDVAYGPVREGYVYTWLHERKDYTVGDMLSPVHFLPANRSLQERLEAFMTDPTTLSENAVRYYLERYSPEAAVRAFVDYSSASACYYGDYEKMGFARRDLIYEAFAALRKRLVQA